MYMFIQIFNFVDVYLDLENDKYSKMCKNVIQGLNILKTDKNSKNKNILSFSAHLYLLLSSYNHLLHL